MCSIAATAAAVATAVALAAAAQTAVPPAAAYAARAGASAATPMAYATLFCVSKVLTCGRERERGRGRAMSIVCFEGAARHKPDDCRYIYGYTIPVRSTIADMFSCNDCKHVSVGCKTANVSV